jgi:ankyrin repeat protein
MVAYSYEDLSKINELDENDDTVLFHALRNGDIDNFKFIFELEMSNITHVNKNGETIKSIAMKTPLSNTILNLLETNKFLTSEEKDIPPFQNVYSNIYELEKILIEDDIDNFKNEFEKYSHDVLELACKYNSTKIAKFCIEKDFEISSIALSFAFFNDNIFIASTMLNKMDKNKLYELDDNNKTPLSYAISPCFNKIKIENPKKNFY